MNMMTLTHFNNPFWSDNIKLHYWGLWSVSAAELLKSLCLGIKYRVTVIDFILFWDLLVCFWKRWIGWIFLLFFEFFKGRRFWRSSKIMSVNMWMHSTATISHKPEAHSTPAPSTGVKLINRAKNGKHVWTFSKDNYWKWSNIMITIIP